MIGLNQKEWDGDILGLVDVNEYNKEVKSTLAEQELNIEIENKPHPASKSVMAQINSGSKNTSHKEQKDNKG